MWLLSFGLGFSSGIMVYVSLVELLPSASELGAESLGEKPAAWLATASFFAGILISALIDKLVPEPDNPHQAVSLRDMASAVQDGPAEGSAESSADKSADGFNPLQGRDRSAVSRVGVLTALAIGLHNFPEGIATFASSLSDMSLGLSIAVAVAIHNIPEGVSVAVPVFFATGSRTKAVLHSFGSGLAEPIGALLAYFVLLSVLNDVVVASMLAAVAGIMVFISFDELLPTAREYGKGHTAIAGVVLGMATMAVSLLLID